MKIKEDRSLALYILLSICTCGVYSYYFVYSMALDANVLCSGDGKETPGLLPFILLSVCTCGIYAIYWEYSLGNRLAENAPRYGLTFQENGSSVLLWRIFGMLLCGLGGFIAINILIKNTNALAHCYNQGLGGNIQQQAYTQPNQNFIQQQPPIQQGQQMYSQQNQQTYIQPNQTPQSGGFVVCSQGLYQGAEFPVEGELIIGRDENCSHIVIKNPEVSRKHCGISYNRANGTYTVTDYSANGLYYKTGQAFPKNVPVICNPGTILVIGNSGNEFLLK